MEPKFLSKYVKIFIVLGIISFFFVGFIVMPTNVGMGAHSDEGMSKCLFTGETTLCQMNPLEHLAAWQRAFTTLPLKDGLALLLIIFSAILLILTAKISAAALFLRRNLYIKRFGFERLYFAPNYLKEAFSNGIIHPKTF